MYNVMKKIISTGNYDKKDVAKKLDIFLAMDRITIEQHAELSEMMK